MILGATTAVLGPTLPALAEHTHTTLSQASVIFTARALGYLLGALLGGRCYDKIPGHPLLSGVLMAITVPILLIPLAESLWLLFLLVLILGIAHGMIQVGGGLLLIWVHQRNVGPFINGQAFFYGIGAILSPVLIAQFRELSGDIVWGYWSLIGMIVPVIVWLLPLSSPSTPGTSPHESAHQRSYVPIILLVTLLYLTYAGTEAGFGHWISPYTAVLHEGNNTVAAYMTSAFWGAMTVGRLLAIPISARVSLGKILVIDVLGGISSAIVIILWSHSLTGIWVGTLGMGLSLASFFLGLLAFTGDHILITGRITGLFFTGAGVSGMTIPWLIGQLFESVGPEATMVTIMINLLIVLGLLIILIMMITKHSSKG